MSGHTRIALVGFGLVGRRHADIIRRAPDLVLSAIVEPSDDGRAIAQNLNVPVFSDLAEMLDTERPEGVILATPTPLHLDQGLACIEAGCPG